MLFPAFEMQQKMQAVIMGTRFWAKIACQREQQARQDKEGEVSWKAVFTMLADIRKEESGGGGGDGGGISDDFTDDEILQGKHELEKEKHKVIGTIAQRREAKSITVDPKKQETRFKNRAKGIHIEAEETKPKENKKGAAGKKKKLKVAARHVNVNVSLQKGKPGKSADGKHAHQHLKHDDEEHKHRSSQKKATTSNMKKENVHAPTRS
jgi:hypothetical protein